MKAFTDLEQSKKLAEFLPIESADMYYFLDPTPAGNIYHLTVKRVDFGIKNLPQYGEGDIPCWSLVALLSIIRNYCTRFELTLRANKKYNLFAMTDNFVYRSFSEYPDGIDNPIDACYKMILKLHELNLL